MDRSVRQSVDPVRRGLHGPGVSVFGSPYKNSTYNLADWEDSFNGAHCFDTLSGKGHST